ncbi:MAG: CRISPR-associated endonuclease Cas2 [Deltaproteobacteria bacterium]|jgi:CRISPR-associated protein Cas2|nr:CRISPR-associated endonuclease Cas2 [Deltaproteobacteria bacterium]
MRKSYIVSYDITGKKRLRNIHKTLLGYGDAVQYSVFHCELSDKELAQLKVEVQKIINHKQDQVLIIDLGPAKGRGQKCMEYLGIPYAKAERCAIIV